MPCPGSSNEEALLPGQCLFHDATAMCTQMWTGGSSTRGRTQGLACPLSNSTGREGLWYGQWGPRAPTASKHLLADGQWHFPGASQHLSLHLKGSAGQEKNRGRMGGVGGADSLVSSPVGVA